MKLAEKREGGRRKWVQAFVADVYKIDTGSIWINENE